MFVDRLKLVYISLHSRVVLYFLIQILRHFSKIYFAMLSQYKFDQIQSLVSETEQMSWIESCFEFCALLRGHFDVIRA